MAVAQPDVATSPRTPNAPNFHTHRFIVDLSRWEAPRTAPAKCNERIFENMDELVNSEGFSFRPGRRAAGVTYRAVLRRKPVITHPDKLLFPADGITKGDVCAYYEQVAGLMLPHIAGRPVTMERYPAGIDKKGFIQKDVSKGFPDWLRRVETSKRSGSEGDGAVHYPLADDARALVWLANQNSITPHVWTSRVPALGQPDLCVFDLDPSQDPSQDPSGDQPAELRAAALAVRDLLAELGLASFVKTSGSKGFHIVVALDGEAGFEPVRRFCQGAGAVLVKRHPALFTQEFIKVDRGGRIFVDTGRNGYGATFAAVYALRPKPGAPVSAPCAWAEIESGAVGPQTFTLRTISARLAEVGDLWRALHDEPHSLRDATAGLERLLTGEEWEESLAATTRRPVSRKRTRHPP
jgi:bifunctional non-homologous end joining protein LigD